MEKRSKMSDREKPIHVLVAEALGKKPVDAAWGYFAPPAEGQWTHLKSQLLPTIEEAEAVYKARKMEHAIPHPWHLSYWREGWGPVYIDRYDDSEDGFVVWDLIKKHGISVVQEDGGPGWTVYYKAYSDYDGLTAEHSADGETPEIAFCKLVLKLEVAGVTLHE